MCSRARTRNYKAATHGARTWRGSSTATPSDGGGEVAPAGPAEWRKAPSPNLKHCHGQARPRWCSQHALQSEYGNRDAAPKSLLKSPPAAPRQPSAVPVNTGNHECAKRGGMKWAAQSDPRVVKLLEEGHSPPATHTAIILTTCHIRI